MWKHAPFTILEDLMRHNKDVIVPSESWTSAATEKFETCRLTGSPRCLAAAADWLGGEQPYDLNSWQESETALALPTPWTRTP